MKQTIYKRIPLDLNMWIETPQQLAEKYLGTKITEDYHVLALTSVYGFPEDSEFDRVFDHHVAVDIDELKKYIKTKGFTKAYITHAISYIKQYPAIALEEKNKDA